MNRYISNEMHRIQCIECNSSNIIQHMEYNAYDTIWRIKSIEYNALNTMHIIWCIEYIISVTMHWIYILKAMHQIQSTACNS